MSNILPAVDLLDVHLRFNHSIFPEATTAMAHTGCISVRLLEEHPNHTAADRILGHNPRRETKGLGRDHTRPEYLCDREPKQAQRHYSHLF